jgi:radical SAM protein with 4Fe4S-binding SPASM domain
MNNATAEQIRTLIADAGLKLPGSPTLMITDDCNLHCDHCWPESGHPLETPPVPLKQLQKMIRNFVLLGSEEICLTGGEPLTHPDWLEILIFSCITSGLKKVCLQTNGTLLTTEIVNTLASKDFKSLTIQVSLEGANAKTHNRVRGRGSFERAFAGIKLLAAAGLGKQTLIAFTETKDNFQELPQLLQVMDDLEIGRLASGTLVRAGRAAENHSLSLPTPLQVEEMLERFHGDKAFRERYERIGNIACLEWLKGRSTPSTESCRCIETPYIKANGTMYPCTMLPVERFAIPDVYSHPTEEIFSKAVSLWTELPELNRRRIKFLKECRSCPGSAHCAGGCMGRAYVASGDPMAVEDRCALRKAVYRWKAPG